MTQRIIFTLLSLFCWSATAPAQFDFARNEPDGARYIGGPRLGKSQTQIWRTGIILEPRSVIDNFIVTTPVPMNWREQKIISINEEKMDANLASRIEYRNLGGAMEMRLQLGRVRPSNPIEIVVAFEVQNYELLPPENPSQYIIPTRVPQDIAPFLRPSPKIESNDSTFSKMYAEITRERKTDWDKVEALYSFVQNTVKYDDTAWSKPAKGALAVTKMPRGEWMGDCKDMSCLFVALCRAGKVPARIVRVPEHCYAEFYLEMKQLDTRTNNNRRAIPPGFWFPCQVSGTYAFGGIPEKRVILQKGDSFPDPDKPNVKQLFLPDFYRGDKESGSPQPKIDWIREAVAK